MSDDSSQQTTADGSQSRRYTGWMKGKWTVFHPYFCPECGEGYDDKTCQGGRPFGIHYLRCPACDRPVIVSGSSIIVIGFVLAFFCSLLLCCGAEELAKAVFLGFGAFGLFRVFKKQRAKRRNRGVA